jgi:chromosome segregation protein
MKYLESVKIAQFFLYEKLEMPIRQITGVVGPNGSGKSTAIDAIQISIFGGHSRWIALNSQADDEHMERTLRTYCLGQYGDQPEQRARDNALTYITLIWRDTKTKKPYSTGVCIYASVDQEKHQVLGRYVVEDIELSLGDHFETVDGQERPRAWESFRQSLIERSRRPSSEILFNEADRYLRSLLMMMRDPGQPVPTVDAFVRAFRFALRMRFDKSVDQIVRNDVLEARPTNIHRFRDLTESFRKLAILVADVEEKIKKGHDVLAHYEKAKLETTKGITWRSLDADASRELANVNLESAISAREIAEATNAANFIALQKMEADIAHEKAEEGRVRTLREAHAGHQNHGVTQANIERLKSDLSTQSRNLTMGSRALIGVLSNASKFPVLSPSSEALLTAAKKISDAGDLTQLPKNIIEVLYRPAITLLKKCCNDVMSHALKLSGLKTDAELRLKELEENLLRAKDGKAALKGPAAELLQTLRDYGLSPLPVCDVVRITDPEWQPVIEAYLGPHRQALLAPDGQENETFSCYRNAKIYGAKVAMASRQKLDVRPPFGSVAELIDGNNPAAVAYLRAKFGDIRRATSDDDAMDGGKTLTKDGMFVTGSDMDRIRPISQSEFCIGERADNQRTQIQADISSMKQQVRSLQEQYDKTMEIFGSMRNFSEETTVINSVGKIHEAILTAQSEIQQWTRQLESSTDDDYVRLGKQLEETIARLNQFNSDAKNLSVESGKLQTIVDEKTRRQTDAQYAYDRDVCAAESARSIAEYSAEFASENWDKLLERFNDDYKAMQTFCHEQTVNAEKRKNDAIKNASIGINTFIEKYREQVASDLLSEWTRAHVWISDTVIRLERTDLVQYKGQMDEAYAASQETFRQDVAVALYNNIQWLDQSVDRLNKALRNCPPFTNGERYQFIRKVRPQLERVLSFVKDVATHGPTGDMFGDAGEIPAQFKELLDEKMSQTSAVARSPLDDYREFYEFDIEILREDPITKLTKRTGLLSKRIGTGSGGEHRSPLYVIAGAALASAYRMDDGSRDSMGLILLDEAFNRMDFTNITSTMRYLEDLGLQVMLASPGENLGVLTAFLHRYYDIQKDPDNNVISLEGHDVSAETRAMFREDIPDFNPALIDQEIRQFA